MPKTLTTLEKANILAGELITTQGCADDVESDAFYEAKTEIMEVLDLLVDVDFLSDERQERTAFIMGQYMFDELCRVGKPEELDTELRPIGDCEIVNGQCVLYNRSPDECIEICDVPRLLDEVSAAIVARGSLNG